MNSIIIVLYDYFMMSVTQNGMDRRRENGVCKESKNALSCVWIGYRQCYIPDYAHVDGAVSVHTRASIIL